MEVIGLQAPDLLINTVLQLQHDMQTGSKNVGDHAQTPPSPLALSPAGSPGRVGVVQVASVSPAYTASPQQAASPSPVAKAPSSPVQQRVPPRGQPGLDPTDPMSPGLLESGPASPFAHNPAFRAAAQGVAMGHYIKQSTGEQEAAKAAGKVVGGVAHVVVLDSDLVDFFSVAGHLSAMPAAGCSVSTSPARPTTKPQMVVAASNTRTVEVDVRHLRASGFANPLFSSQAKLAVSGEGGRVKLEDASPQRNLPWARPYSPVTPSPPSPMHSGYIQPFYAARHMRSSCSDPGSPGMHTVLPGKQQPPMSPLSQAQLEDVMPSSNFAFTSHHSRSSDRTSTPTRTLGGNHAHEPQMRHDLSYRAASFAGWQSRPDSVPSGHTPSAGISAQMQEGSMQSMPSMPHNRVDMVEVARQVAEAVQTLAGSQWLPQPQQALHSVAAPRARATEALPRSCAPPKMPADNASKAFKHKSAAVAKPAAVELLAATLPTKMPEGSSDACTSRSSNQMHGAGPGKPDSPCAHPSTALTVGSAAEDAVVAEGRRAAHAVLAALQTTSTASRSSSRVTRSEDGSGSRSATPTHPRYSAGRSQQASPMKANTASQAKGLTHAQLPSSNNTAWPAGKTGLPRHSRNLSTPAQIEIDSESMCSQSSAASPGNDKTSPYTPGGSRRPRLRMRYTAVTVDEGLDAHYPAKRPSPPTSPPRHKQPHQQHTGSHVAGSHTSQNLSFDPSLSIHSSVVASNQSANTRRAGSHRSAGFERPSLQSQHADSRQMDGSGISNISVHARHAASNSGDVRNQGRIRRRSFSATQVLHSLVAGLSGRASGSGRGLVTVAGGRT